ncbi:hypothetical protein PHMEG_00017920 [Phytophthora megakarya]|uniref:Uncharacterized protein n=1 Tax=Phytophthora megakarya TaxID=4795 RepID=A0A225VVL0_9STRA|nr:hypothetical protein PHMEG_00017920 [Phytophthora megakarya]
MFEMCNLFGQAVMVEACNVDGCHDVFLVGVDFLERHRASIDYRNKEVWHDKHRRLIVIPLRMDSSDGNDNRARVQLASATKLRRRAVQPIEVLVAARDGEGGIFLPTGDLGFVLTAAAVTKVNGGKAIVHVINVHSGQIWLPRKQEVGVWVPAKGDITMLTAATRPQNAIDVMRQKRSATSEIEPVGMTERECNAASDEFDGDEKDPSASDILRLTDTENNGGTKEQ